MAEYVDADELIAEVQALLAQFDAAEEAADDEDYWWVNLNFGVSPEHEDTFIRIMFPEIWVIMEEYGAEYAAIEAAVAAEEYAAVEAAVAAEPVLGDLAEDVGALGNLVEGDVLDVEALGDDGGAFDGISLPLLFYVDEIRVDEALGRVFDADELINDDGGAFDGISLPALFEDDEITEDDDPEDDNGEGLFRLFDAPESAIPPLADLAAVEDTVYHNFFSDGF